MERAWRPAEEIRRFSSGTFGAERLWATRSQAMGTRFPASPTAATEALLASGSVDNTVIVWDARDGTRIEQPLVGHQSTVDAVAFSPDGKWLASGDDNGLIMLWSVGHWGAGVRLVATSHVISALAFSPDSRRLASGNGDGTIVLWDVVDARTVGVPMIGHSGGVSTVVFAPRRRPVGQWRPDRHDHAVGRRHAATDRPTDESARRKA